MSGRGQDGRNTHGVSPLPGTLEWCLSVCSSVEGVGTGSLASASLGLTGSAEGGEGVGWEPGREWEGHLQSLGFHVVIFGWQRAQALLSGPSRRELGLI